MNTSSQNFRQCYLGQNFGVTVALIAQIDCLSHLYERIRLFRPNV